MEIICEDLVFENKRHSYMGYYILENLRQISRIKLNGSSTTIRASYLMNYMVHTKLGENYHENQPESNS